MRGANISQALRSIVIRLPEMLKNVRTAAMRKLHRGEEHSDECLL